MHMYTHIERVYIHIHTHMDIYIYIHTYYTHTSRECIREEVKHATALPKPLIPAGRHCSSRCRKCCISASTCAHDIPGKRKKRKCCILESTCAHNTYIHIYYIVCVCVCVYIHTYIYILHTYILRY